MDSRFDRISGDLEGGKGSDKLLFFLENFEEKSRGKKEKFFKAESKLKTVKSDSSARESSSPFQFAPSTILVSFDSREERIK